MWISTKAQYGLRALVDIARQSAEVVPLKDVSRRQGISQAYLEQIASNLRRSGFIKSVRGASGGYKLARVPDLISAYDVVVALEGSIAPVDCVESDHSCERSGLCSALAVEDLPAHDFAAEEVDEQVQVEVLAPHLRGQISDVPAVDLVGPRGHQSAWLAALARGPLSAAVGHLTGLA